MAAGRAVTRRLAGLAVPLALAGAGCATGVTGSGALGGAGPWDTVAFERNSWGRPITAWQVNSNGAGLWTEGSGPGRSTYTLEHHALAVGPEGYARLSALLEDVPIPAPSSEDCEVFATDMPYGKLRLIRGATTVELSYNVGCRDEGYQRFIAALQAVDALVESWGKAAPVSHRETVQP